MTRKTSDSATNYPIDAVYTTKVRFFVNMPRICSKSVYEILETSMDNLLIPVIFSAATDYR